MTIRHMKIFICVFEEDGMTRAAEKLHMTQPSVSQAIQELENHYDTLLFERLGRKLFITDAGQRLLQYARNVVNLDSQMESGMRSFGKICHLRIGASVTIGECVLVDLLQYIYQKNPAWNVFSEIHNTTDLEIMLLQDKLDLALVEGHIQSEYLEQKAFMEDELIFIISPENYYRREQTIKRGDLSKFKFFVREVGSGTRDLFEQVMTAAKREYKLAGVYNNAETIKQVVQIGLGVSAISKRAVRRELGNGELIGFSIPGLVFKREFHIVYHRNKYIVKELQNIIDLCYKIDEFL